jgi:tetratricopeptide (TPR) repeat protein
MSESSTRHEELSEMGSRTEPLWQVYDRATEYSLRDDQTQARQLLQTILPDLASYTGAPDTWHNTAMVAGRVGHYDAQLRIIEEGLRQWPHDVDLLCDELQERYGRHYDEKRAEEIWEQLERSMLPEQTGAYWRFWVYGAVYHGRVLRNRQKAMELLDSGLLAVTRDNLMDIISGYRRVLVDSVPAEGLRSLEEVEEYQRDALAILEKRYRLGIRLGVENGHVLAIQLAQLSRERAGEDIDRSGGGQLSRKEIEKTREHLEQALKYLDLAETIYTGMGGMNHPVHDIYEERARVLMAMREYEEALYLLRSLPTDRQQEMSLSAMTKLAAFKTGTELESADDEVPLQSADVEVPLQEALQQVIPALLDNDGELLFRIARENPPIQRVLLQVANQLKVVRGESND